MQQFDVIDPLTSELCVMPVCDICDYVYSVSASSVLQLWQKPLHMCVSVSDCECKNITMVEPLHFIAHKHAVWKRHFYKVFLWYSTIRTKQTPELTDKYLDLARFCIYRKPIILIFHHTLPLIPLNACNIILCVIVSNLEHWQLEIFAKPWNTQLSVWV